MMKNILLLVALTLQCCLAHPGHSHDNEDNSNGKQTKYRTCAADTKTQHMLSIDETYKSKYEEIQSYADEYVSYMKEHKIRSFNKQISSMTDSTPKNEETKNTKTDKKQNRLFQKMQKNEKEKRKLLFSQYDDSIDSEPVIVIPIVYHVLYSKPSENLPDAQLDSQINVLNNDFRALNSEIVDGKVDSIWSDRVGDTKLEFYKNATNRVSIASTATICADEGKMKVTANGGSSGWDPEIYLNVWICNMTDNLGYLGYAYFPCMLGGSYEYLDGLVLTSGAVGSYKDDTEGTFIFDYSVYNEGRTATHEIGHYLNLEHIWGDDGCSATDSVSDTPAADTSNYGCPPNTTNSCTEIDPEKGVDLRDMYENYMDYTNDACMYIFTEEQVWRMRSVFDSCRTKMYENGARFDTTTGGNTGTNTGGTDTGGNTGTDTGTNTNTNTNTNGNSGTGTDTNTDTNTDNSNTETNSETDNGALYCNNGDPITDEFLNDGDCYCSCCEDEDDWTCETCSSDEETCSESSFTHVTCDGTGDGSITGSYCNVTNGLQDQINGNSETENESENASSSGNGELSDDAWMIIIILIIAFGAGLIIAIGITIWIKCFKQKNDSKSTNDNLVRASFDHTNHIVPVSTGASPMPSGATTPREQAEGAPGGPPPPPPFSVATTQPSAPPLSAMGRKPPPRPKTNAGRRAPPPPSSMLR